MKQINQVMYLDNAATTPLSPQVKQAIMSTLDNYYNPSSVYQNGKNVRKLIEANREKVATFINADSDDIYFTSSGSASNTLAIKGYLTNGYIYYSPIAHKSVIKCVKSLHNPICKIPINKDGLFDLEKLEMQLSAIQNSFVIVDYANSEIGTVQNIKELSAIVHRHNGVIYVDCTGSIPTIPLDVKELNIDMAGFSAHKLGALKGCGVLYKAKNLKLEPLVYGNQENGLFGGTENVLGIVSLGTAIENYNYSSVTSYQRDYVLAYFKKNISDCYLVGSESYRLPNNLYLCIKNINGSQLMALLDIYGIQVSTGSACNNYSSEPSNVLTAINLKSADLLSCIRISFSCHETKKQLDYLCKKLEENIKFLRKL